MITVPGALATTGSPSSPARLKSIALAGLWPVRVCPDQVCPQGNGTLKVGAAAALVAGSSTPATTIPIPSAPSHRRRM